MYLDDNALTGPIPPELGQLTNLVNLRLGNNQLTGCVPETLAGWVDDLPACGTAIAVEATALGSLPATSGLDPNFPNPFNAGTQIAYRLATSGPVRLEIYNTLGQSVRALADEVQAAGAPTGCIGTPATEAARPWARGCISSACAIRAARRRGACSTSSRPGPGVASLPPAPRPGSSRALAAPNGLQEEEETLPCVWHRPTTDRMDREDYFRWAERAARWGAEYLATLEERSVRAQTAPGEIAAMLPAAPPEEPVDMETIFADFERIVPEGMTHWQHRRFFAYFPANAAPASMIAENLTSGHGGPVHALADLACGYRDRDPHGRLDGARPSGCRRGSRGSSRTREPRRISAPC